MRTVRAREFIARRQTVLKAEAIIWLRCVGGATRGAALCGRLHTLIWLEQRVSAKAHHL